MREDAATELTKVAKVLTALQQGKNIKNKRIDAVLGEGDNYIIVIVPNRVVLLVP